MTPRGTRPQTRGRARRGRRARLALLAGCGVCLGAGACLLRERVNNACRWTGDTATLAPPGDPARRAHLLTDVRLADDLGIRYGDSVGGRLNWAPNGDARARCTEASLAEVARRHGVPRAELASLAGAREWWVDLLAVFLPMAVLYVAASRMIVGRLVARYAPGERAGAAAILVFWAPFAAALALGVTQLWGATVETMRLGNGHISNRIFELPASRHGWLVWGGAVGLFAAIAAGALARTPAAATPPRRRR